MLALLPLPVLSPGKDPEEKWNKILNFYSKIAGEKLVLIDEVYKSEAATNTGNKALSMLLAKYERIYAEPFESVDIYTKQCSVGVNATQLARMGRRWQTTVSILPQVSK
jgi:glutaminase